MRRAPIYFHHSTSYIYRTQANTNKYETTISKERRKLIGNKES